MARITMRKVQETKLSEVFTLYLASAATPAKENHGTEFLGCFEEVYEKDGETYMDIFIHADCVGRGNLHTDFRRDM